MTRPVNRRRPLEAQGGSTIALVLFLPRAYQAYRGVPPFPGHKKMSKIRNKDDFDWTQASVVKLFEFLQRNTKWNREFQEREYARCLAGCHSARERMTSFLHLNVSTQSSADMNDLLGFWKALHGAAPEQTASLKAFTAYLVDSSKGHTKNGKSPFTAREAETDDWAALFLALHARPGWGIKTTALFVKAAIRLHRGPQALHFWPDAWQGSAGSLQSKPYLPVDRVILHIFKTLGHPCPRVENINSGLRSRYSAEQMLTWDDLWFWGFFTQTGTDDERELGWNSGKFWSQLSSSKNDETQLRSLGETFIGLLTAKS